MRAYDMRRGWLFYALETYRATPPEAARRQFIDRLMVLSRNAAGNDPQEKKYHNLTVLQYITGTRPAKLRICAALHIGRRTYDITLGHAVDRLTVLAFGANGIDWAATKQAGSG